MIRTKVEKKERKKEIEKKYGKRLEFVEAMCSFQCLFLTIFWDKRIYKKYKRGERRGGEGKEARKN